MAGLLSHHQLPATGSNSTTIKNIAPSQRSDITGTV
jgi:hypothetical protein